MHICKRVLDPGQIAYIHRVIQYQPLIQDESEATPPSKSPQNGEFKLPADILNYRGPGHSAAAGSSGGGGNRTSDSSFDEGSIKSVNL